MALYHITRVTDQLYIDEGAQPVNGFAVTFEVAELNQVHTINVPHNNPVEIDTRIRQEIAKYQQIARLGG